MNDTKLKEIEEQLETIYDELTIFKGRYIDEDNEDNIDEALSGTRKNGRSSRKSATLTVSSGAVETLKAEQGRLILQITDISIK